MYNIGKYFKGDKTIWLIVLLLSIFSLLVVYSSTAALASRAGITPFYYFFRQLIFLCLGFALIFIISRTPYTLFMGLAPYGFYLCVGLLLALVLFGKTDNEARRSLFGFQPIEICKVLLLTYTARQVTVKQDVIKNLRSGYLPVLMPVIIVCALIFIVNFSSAAILGLTCLIMMLIGRVRMRHLLATIGILLAVLAAAMGITKIIVDKADAKREQLHIAANKPLPGVIGVFEKAVDKTRLHTMYSRLFQHVKKTGSGGYDQADYSRIAIASGGIILGKGPGNSKLRYKLPEAYSDYVFAIVIEEYGVIISSLLLLCYLIILYRVGVMTKKATHFFPTLLAIGISIQITLQALVHMCVVTGISPVTGQNLPFISRGGSSLLVTCIMLGMLLSVSRNIDAREELAKQAAAENDKPATQDNEQVAVETLANLNS